VKVLITGADGFLGSNLRLRLSERPDVQVQAFTRASGDPGVALQALVADADFVFHLAGVNRPQDPAEFVSGNADLTRMVCAAVSNVARQTGRHVSVVFTSSIQAGLDNAYGQSKRNAEDILRALQAEQGIPIHVFRLPNVFGKWCRPNYNSVIATFCHNIARGLPIQVGDPAAPVRLVYVDDVLQCFVELMDGRPPEVDAQGCAFVKPEYQTTVGELARLISAFRDSRATLMTERVGTGLTRALYATYVSYLSTESFAYAVPHHGDARGALVEVLKTPDCGQVSCFTACPGASRGGHYHYTKTEKFLVIKGRARFRFRHMQSGETHELMTSGDKAEIVETVPGWAHDITNIGDDEMVVMLWANEVFDRARPDTHTCSL
jgi:UDP-2-acetamido-2,6-beta-L-arabino-hexul-4-ose reductase